MNSFPGLDRSTGRLFPQKTPAHISWREFAKGLGFVLLGVFHLLLSPSLRAAGGGLAVNFGGPAPGLDEIVLFPFDDYTIPFRYQLQTGLVPSKSQSDPHTHVLEKGKPGSVDGHNLQFYGSIRRVGDELRMWYIGSPAEGDSRVCYAVSSDGLKWEKPTLGLVEFAGDKNNNLVAFNHTDIGAILVLHEPEDPDPERRFKMVYEISPSDVRAAFSPDGLRWKDSPDNPIIKHNYVEPGGLTKFNGCYYMTGQGGNVGTKRALVTYQSSDFKNWSDAVVLGLRRDAPPHRETAGMHAGEQVHLGAALWNRGNVLLGVYGQWHGESNDRRFLTIDLGLVVSNDALHYREPIPDFQLVSAYEIYQGSDSKNAPVAAAPALEQGQAFENIGDNTYFWYSPWWGGSICVARWTKDRLGYFETVKGSRANRLARENPNPPPKKETPKKDASKPASSPSGPHFISCLLQTTSPDTKIFLNAAGLSSQSQLRVELLDKDFNPLPDYSGKDSVPVTESGVRRPVTWRSKQTLEGLSSPFRIKVQWEGRTEDALVYALYVADK